VKILRVFPRRTAMTPDDELSFVGDPPLFRPPDAVVDEVHVSCTFTWDRNEAWRLEAAWREHYPFVRIGGPAFASGRWLTAPSFTSAPLFVPGLYLRPGVTITSRGCPNRCPWCLVPQREGPLRELSEIAPGHEIQDNNLLACSREHFRRGCEMLAKQRRAAIFSGGLDPRRLSLWHIERLKSIRIRRLYVAWDLPEMSLAAVRAIQHLRDAGLDRRKVRCYVLIGYDDQTLEGGEARLRAAWEAGATPFAMLWRGPRVEGHYGKEWKALARRWARDRVIHARMKEGQ